MSSLLDQDLIIKAYERLAYAYAYERLAYTYAHAYERLATTVEPLLLWFPAHPSEGPMDKPGKDLTFFLAVLYRIYVCDMNVLINQASRH